MAQWRKVPTQFWQDPEILEMTPEDKLFFLYLLTNVHTTACGCYSLPIKIAAVELGFSTDALQQLIERFIGYRKILYDYETQEVLVLDWTRYNPVNSPKLKKLAEQEIQEIRSPTLAQRAREILSGYPTDRVSIGYRYGIGRVSIGYGGDIDKDIDKREEKENKGEPSVRKTPTVSSVSSSNEEDDERAPSTFVPSPTPKSPPLREHENHLQEKEKESRAARRRELEQLIPWLAEVRRWRRARNLNEVARALVRWWDEHPPEGWEKLARALKKGRKKDDRYTFAHILLKEVAVRTPTPFPDDFEVTERPTPQDLTEKQLAYLAGYLPQVGLPFVPEGELRDPWRWIQRFYRSGRERQEWSEFRIAYLDWAFNVFGDWWEEEVLHAQTQGLAV